MNKQHVIVRSLLNMVVPRFCNNCGCWLTERTILCAPCTDVINPVVSKELFITSTASMHVYAVSDYAYPLKSLILAKSHGNRVASMHLGHLLWQMSTISTMDFDIIVPIPLHWTRYAYRGYNQAEVLAQVLARYSKKPVVNLLKRTKRTIFQSKLPLKQRAENVKNVFKMVSVTDHHDYYGKKILLVDDLMTTGSTFKYAARELLALKPASIAGVVACRVV